MAKKPEGRPLKLNPEVHDKIIQALRMGNYREVVATYAGIHVATLYRWLEEGEADLDHDKATPQRELYEAATRAEAEAEVAAVAALRMGFMGRAATERRLEDGTVLRTEAIDPDWRAAGEYLRRRHRARWSSSDKLEVQGDHTVHGSVPIEIVPSAEQEAEIARILAQAHGGSDE